MSTFVPVPNSALVAMQFVQNNGDMCENTFWVEKGSEFAAADLVTLANLFVDWYATGGTAAHAYKTHMSSNSFLTQVLARDMSTSAGAEGVPSVAMPVAGGGGAGTMLQNGLCFTITHRTGLAGRSYRGRTYVPCLSTDVVAAVGANSIIGATADALVAELTGLMTNIHAHDATWNLVVASRYSGVTPAGRPIPRVTGITTPIVQMGYKDLFLDYQRRRAPAHNRHH